MASWGLWILTLLMSLTHTSPANRLYRQHHQCRSQLPVAVIANSLLPSTTNLQVFSAQAGDRKEGSFQNAGTADLFVPHLPFKPDERVLVTDSGLAQPYVFGFTTAAGRSPATLGANQIGVGPYPASVVTANVDGDGDLDMLTANTASNDVSVRFNGVAPLTAFSAQDQSDLVLLTWQTQTQTNFAGFHLERSSDAQEFVALTWIPAQPQGRAFVSLELGK